MEVCHLEVGFEVSELHRRIGVSLCCLQQSLLQLHVCCQAPWHENNSGPVSETVSKPIKGFQSFLAHAVSSQNRAVTETVPFVSCGLFVPYTLFSVLFAHLSVHSITAYLWSKHCTSGIKNSAALQLLSC